MAFKWVGNQKDRLSSLFNNGFLSDITLLLGPDKEEVKCHKFVLSVGSSVMHKRIKSLEDAFSDDLLFPDVEPHIFKQLLRYIYTDEITPTFNEALPLLHLASEFEIPALVTLCAKIIKGNFSVQNILAIFQKAKDAGHYELIHGALQYICRSAATLLTHESFTNISLDCLIEIVQQDDLQVEREIDVFNAVCRWGAVECQRQGLNPKGNKNMQKVVEDVLPSIRFPLMEQKEFALNVTQKKLLPMEDVVGLLVCFSVPLDQRGALDCQYSSTPRNYTRKQSIPMQSNPVPQSPEHRQAGNAALFESFNMASKWAEK